MQRVARGWIIVAGAGLIVLALFVALAVISTSVPVASTSVSASAQTSTDILDKVAFVQNLNAQIPLDLAFRDTDDQSVRIGDYFGARPVILVMGYFNCPNLCDMVRQGLLDTLRTLPFNAGRDYNVVAVSIDPGETPKIAADAQTQYIADYGRAGTDSGVAFLTGSPVSISRLAQVIGFQYAYDDSIKQYAHPAGVIVLTPAGKVSRYFYGVQFDSTDLRLGLVEASASKIGTVIDQVLLRCYHYDPGTGKYTPVILNALTWAAMVTVVGLAFFVYRLHRGKASNNGDELTEVLD